MKTNSWLRMHEIIDRNPNDGLVAQVIYTSEDLILPLSKQLILDVNTVIVVLSDKNHVSYVGVAQTSPRDSYNRNLGREIAAGRALKAFLQAKKGWNDVREYYAYKVSNSNESGMLVGKIPTTIPIQEIVDALRQP